MENTLQRVRELAEQILDEIATAEAIEAQRAAAPMFNIFNTNCAENVENRAGGDLQ